MSVAERLVESAERWPNRPFLELLPSVAARYDCAPTTQTFAEVAETARRLRDRYRDAGYRAGLRVGLALENRPAFLVHFYALNGLGVSIVPINVEMSAAEQSHLLSHSDLSLVVAARPAIERLASVAAGLPRPVPVAVDGFERPPPPASTASVSAPDEAALVYTSGTTGQPKGCMLSNAYFIGMGERYLGMGGFCHLEAGRERLITPLPFTHMNALACSMMAMLMAGGCLVQLDRFHPGSWWQQVRASRATVVHYLGVMPAMLLNLPPDEDDFSSQVKFGFGAGCDPRHQATFESRFGFPLIEAWAMTETGAGAWISADHEPRHVGTRCFGRAPENLEYRLVDEHGADVPAGEPGELLVRQRGPEPRAGFFSGYYQDPGATAAAWAGGWFHTGDVVRVDGDGAFYFVDRRKNVIRRSGENIAAVEVEGVLLQHPNVAHCAVTAVPDEVRGDEVMALVVPADSGRVDSASAQAIGAFALEHLAYFKIPGWLAFVPELPKTASEKVQRGEVKRIAREHLECGAATDLRRMKKRPDS